MELLADRDVAKVYHASWQELLEVVPRCDALIVDAPYSERTHAGHDTGSRDADTYSEWCTKSKRGETKAESRSDTFEFRTNKVSRRTISYACWSPADVCAFVESWSPRTDGWIVSITDHVLAPIWEKAFNDAGRYVFAPLPFVMPGGRVRLSGDGPSAWTCWVIVARPKNRDFQRWGTLPGAYVVPIGHGRSASSLEVVGGKPQWLMERLVEDYSRPGQLVVDPCCGAGTTVTAAIRTGRRAVGGDAMREHAELAAKAVGGMQQAPLFCGGAA